MSKNLLNKLKSINSSVELTKNCQSLLKGGMDWEGRPQSCNVVYDANVPGAFGYALDAAQRCGGSFTDYLRNLDLDHHPASDR